MSELSRLMILTTKLSNMTTLVREHIQKHLDELSEAMVAKTGNTQFDNGFNLAAKHELKFLQDLVIILSLEINEKEQ